MPLAVAPAISASLGFEGESMFIATLIAARRLSSGDISVAEDALRSAGIEPMGRSWIEEDEACDILFSADPAVAKQALEGLIPGADLVVQGEAGRRRRLLVADMDSTMITVECIDELADYAGRKAEVAAVTERAMLGEIDFATALRERVALLEGLEEAVLDRCHAERVRITPGARALVRTMRREGAYCLLVSGGFSRFADQVACAIGFDRAVSNMLVVGEGRLTGVVGEPIVGAEGKLEALAEAAARQQVDLSGLGVAYRAKPKVADAADARIGHGDLGALLFAQGYSRSEWED